MTKLYIFVSTGGTVSQGLEYENMILTVPGANALPLYTYLPPDPTIPGPTLAGIYSPCIDIMDVSGTILYSHSYPVVGFPSRVIMNT